MSTRPILTAKLIREIRAFIAGAILFNQTAADQLGINSTDQQMMNLLELRGPITPGELARLTGLTTGGVTVVLDRLETAGYVRRERHPRDRRSLLVSVVPEKMAKVHKFYEPVNKAMDQIFSAYDDKELGVIANFFETSNHLRRQSANAQDATKTSQHARS